jgi:hypothetical protein
LAIQNWKGILMNAHTPLTARKSDRWSSNLVEQLDHALDNFDWDKSDAHASLSELATSIEITGHSVDPDSAIIDGDKWQCPGSIFVRLGYDVNSDEPVIIDDSYPIAVEFKFDGEVVEIEKIEADTSSFYE